MPSTVPASFDAFFNAINLSGDHREVANARRDHIVSMLSKSFTIIDSFSSGSIPRFTALRAHADLDVMVVLHWTYHIKDKTPSQVLQAVSKALDFRTGVRKNGQAVTLGYATWPNVDIVPVSVTYNADSSVSHYNVPDSNTEAWIQSNPKTHAITIESKANECGPNFRRIIKMLKHWNRGHSDYLQSYHIEVLALRIFSGTLGNIGWDLTEFFNKARGLVAEPLYYGSAFVDNYLSTLDRAEILKRLQTAYEQSRQAWYQTYGTNSNHRAGIEKWRQLFGDSFPAYG